MYKIKKYDIFMAELPYTKGSSVIKGRRPVLVVSNNLANEYSDVISVVPLTSKEKRELPTHFYIHGYGLKKPSVGLAEQTQTIDKHQLCYKIGRVDDLNKMYEIDYVLKMQLSI